MVILISVIPQTINLSTQISAPLTTNSIQYHQTIIQNILVVNLCTVFPQTINISSNQSPASLTTNSIQNHQTIIKNILEVNLCTVFHKLSI